LPARNPITLNLKKVIMSSESPAGKALYQRIGLVLGPVVALIVAFGFSPEGLPREAIIVAAIGLLMAIWWATEALPVAITAFLPLVALPIPSSICSLVALWWPWRLSAAACIGVLHWECLLWPDLTAARWWAAS
jgi:di/tricarboxylate transporter